MKVFEIESEETANNDISHYILSKPVCIIVESVFELTMLQKMMSLDSSIPELLKKTGLVKTQFEVEIISTKMNQLNIKFHKSLIKHKEELANASISTPPTVTVEDEEGNTNDF